MNLSASDGRGWKMVPVEPTEEMITAGECSIFEHAAAPRDWTLQATKDGYRAMIAAAPSSATPPITAEEIARVREALEPFARWIDTIDKEMPDHEIPDGMLIAGSNKTAKVGDLRKAREALTILQRAGTGT